MTASKHTCLLAGLITLGALTQPAAADIFGYKYNSTGMEITSGLANYYYLDNDQNTTLTFKTTVKGPVEVSFSAVCRFETLLSNSNNASVDIDIRIDGKTVPVHNDGLNSNYFCTKPAGLSTADTEMINSTSVIYPALSAGTHSLKIRLKGIYIANQYAISIFNSTVIVKR